MSSAASFAPSSSSIAAPRVPRFTSPLKHSSLARFEARYELTTHDPSRYPAAPGSSLPAASAPLPCYRLPSGPASSTPALALSYPPTPQSSFPAYQCGSATPHLAPARPSRFLHAPAPQHVVMSSTSSILDSDLDLDQFHQDNLSHSSDATYCGEDAFASLGEFGHGGHLYSDPSHPRTTFSSDSPLFSCAQCGWVTRYGEQLDFHLKAHAGDCLFQCFVGTCEAAFEQAEALVVHTRQHGREMLQTSSAMGKRSWDQAEYEDEVAWSYTPHQPTKKLCVEPITPITPSRSYTTSRSLEGMPFRSSTMSVSRTLSYGNPPPPQMPALSRANSYDGGVPSRRPTSARSTHSQNDSYTAAPAVLELPRPTTPSSATLPTFTIPASPAASTVCTPYTPHAKPASTTTSYFELSPSHPSQRMQGLLASPVHISSSAPVDRGHFQPYSEVGSTSMSVSHSLPQPPQQFLTPRQARTIHSKREGVEQPYYSPATSTPHREYDHMGHNGQFQLQSPVSPATVCPPALVPIPHTSPSRRPSSASNYTPTQAALVSAASMNRLLSRLPPPSSSVSPSPLHSPPTPAVSAIHPRYREPPASSYSTSARSTSPQKPEKMHQCVQEGCGKRFKRLEHLKRHERTHTLEKPYGCDVPGCGRWFSRSDNLAQHRKTHDRNGKTSRAMAAAAAARAAAEAAAIAAAGVHI
ncbi:hypothetical protein JCM1841_006135 [Sporobolomyces salmonicolor]